MWGAFWNSIENLNLAFKILTGATILIPFVLATSSYFVNARVRELQTISSKQEIVRIEQQTKSAFEQAKSADDQAKSADAQATKLKEQNEDLAKQLAVIKEQASDLRVQARNAERGVVDIYDFNGARRQSVAGKNSVSVGPEIGVFQQMIKLHDDKIWLQLASLSEEQIKHTPTWLTPYLFSGIANLNLMRLPEGRARLEFVAEKAGSDPNYSEASRILSDLKASGK